MSASADILKQNLSLLRRQDPELAERIEQTEPVALDWVESKAGPLTASLMHNDRPLWLASRYDPVKEAAKLVEGIEHDKSACVVVLGMGLGYHVAELAKDMGLRGVLIVFEPDIGVWRAVMEKIDHRAWLCRGELILADGETDRAALLKRTEKHAGTVTQGTHLLTHPPTRQRNEQAIRDFGKTVAEVLAFCRTNVATALVNAARTCRNLASNIDHYAAGAGTDDLFNAAKGYPAVCVAAGPSLVKNVDLLRDRDTRSKVVVIAAQTALKPLLARGIRPDFVTALDYSHISSRFYEDLPPLPDVTLVAEAKAHRAILEAFPGPIRVPHSQFNDLLLDTMAVPRIPLKSGATVAHLSFYLAQHLGCDPIMFIGQDLGFSDGLYYAPGTAVHKVWSSEINPFNTIEMMEWRRVVRMKAHLRRAEDVHGRPIFTDEQMATYLKQFERDFAVAKQTILDTTEGGMPKQHAQQMTLAEALKQYATRPVPKLPIPGTTLDRERLGELREVLRKRVRQVNDLRSTTQKTIPILRQMQEYLRDKARVDKLFARLNKLQKHVEEELASTFTLVNALNTVGSFKRAKADRAIAHISRDQVDRQTHQLERDIVNLDWVTQACDEALNILDEAQQRVSETYKQLETKSEPVISAKTNLKTAV
ncbi:MAG: 6-hydroxymethylpterin diphosphokinase MptE-like protein [Phycisphaerales bacterium]